MALHYFTDYELSHNSLNFGDSINPMLCKHFFHKSIMSSEEICLVGIGTILNDQNIERVQSYKKKIIFSSGTGYGDFNLCENDRDSWDFTCVRGPLTAEKLNLPEEKAICDGAILLSDLFPPAPASQRDGILFIPHVNTVWSSGKSLEKICKSLDIKMLSPGVKTEEFINAVRNAELVITEAMHGAILADTMRTPWIPFDMRDVEPFKWQDWFASINLKGKPIPVKPMLYDEQNIFSINKAPIYVKARLKQYIVKQKIKKLLNTANPFLSEDCVLQQKITELHAKVDYINDIYAK